MNILGEEILRKFVWDKVGVTFLAQDAESGIKMIKTYCE